MQLDHVLVLARDLAKMKAFFTQVIGFEEGPRPPFRFAGSWLYSDGRPQIHLASADQDGAQRGHLGQHRPGSSGPVHHIALTGADAAELLARLSANDVAHRVQRVPEEGQVQIFVSGPEGVTVEMLFPESTIAPENR